jgi:hypothetical protein
VNWEGKRKREKYEKNEIGKEEERERGEEGKQKKKDGKEKEGKRKEEERKIGKGTARGDDDQNNRWVGLRDGCVLVFDIQPGGALSERFKRPLRILKH